MVTQTTLSIPVPRAPSAVQHPMGVNHDRVQQVARPAIREGNIVLLDEDVWGMRLCTCAGVLFGAMVPAEIVGMIMAMCALSSPSALPLLLFLVLYCSIVPTIALSIASFDNVDRSDYRNPQTLERARQHAKTLNFGQLVSDYGLERVDRYNLLPFEERRKKWAEWKTNYNIRDERLTEDVTIEMALERGFMNEDEFLKRKEWLSTRHNFSGAAYLEKRASFHRSIGLINSPEPAKKFQKDTMYMRLGAVLEAYDFWDLAYKHHALTADEYDHLNRLKTEFKDADTVTRNRLNTEFHIRFHPKP